MTETSSGIVSLLPLVIALSILGLCFFSAHKTQTDGSIRTHVLTELMKIEENNVQSSEKASLNVKILNTYIERDGEPNWQYPWLISGDGEEQIILAEPFRESKLFITSDDGVTPLSSHNTNFEWRVVSSDGETVNKYSGTNSLDIVFETIGVQYVFVSKFDLAHQEIATARVKVYVRYVRREIRSLTDEDLDMTLDTMALLWRVPQDEGLKLYGDNYYSADKLLKVHLALAGASECDHMHDGMGFIPHHAALTILFERSIQAVNPKVSLPYWDYALDFQKIADLGEGADYMEFLNSEVFTAKYFGSTDEETHYIKDGRWAGLTVPTTDYLSEEEFETLPHNAFGYLRAPWSSNSDPGYIRTSYMCGVDPSDLFPVSKCDKFQTLLMYDTLVDWGKAVSYDPHGPVHILLGGAVGCKDAYERLNELFDEDTVHDLTQFAFGLHKNLFRWDLIVCEEGKDYCTCPDLEKMIQTEDGLNEIIVRSGLKSIIGDVDLTLEQQKLVADVMCNSHLKDGDQLQASSSYAPEFWPIHPTLERAYQYKMLEKPFGSLDWMDGTGTWLQHFYKNDDCTGHKETDIILDGYFPLSIGNKDTLTNREFMDLLDPSLSVLDYVYDNFDW
eukprot:CAMPEP_0117750630 /NCGR_PEP_ID=MMETSP0947-20121206/10488_1 /TAXON_ID=44440 /ORGANISM="Chattonella subsalsa, Strain CCMP2191" /LENGTH=616 /DNA_ID=CAMNT_0005568845 /DNA_START=104 /DNA_END=1951 /DNA_ORIENTATION=+